MTWLFDVNVLVAIADPEHVFHPSIHRWTATQVYRTWATCPITENGMIGVMSQQSYHGSRITAPEAIETLRAMKAPQTWKHEFWPDSFSITESAMVLSGRIAGPKQLTDVYLAGLAKKNGGRLVTFDTSVAWHAVAGGSVELIEVPAL